MPEVIQLNERELYIAIGKLFASFPSTARRGANLEAYVEALSRIPTSFVQDACDYAVSGRIGDGKSIPPAAELAHLARTLHVRTLPRTRISENYVINDPNQRKSIIQGFKGLLVDLRRGKMIDPDLATTRVFGLKRDQEDL